MKKLHTIYLSIGTNKGNRLENLQNAINLITNRIGIIKQIANIYETKSLGFDGADFYNTCVEVSTYLKAENLITKTLAIEFELGRIKNNNNEYTDRIIDIDILLCDNEVIHSKSLIVPHPRMLARKFVLVPLVEIAKNIIHPTEKKSLYNCLHNCTDNSEITIINKQLKRPIDLDKK